MTFPCGRCGFRSVTENSMCARCLFIKTYNINPEYAKLLRSMSDKRIAKVRQDILDIPNHEIEEAMGEKHADNR